MKKIVFLILISFAVTAMAQEPNCKDQDLKVRELELAAKENASALETAKAKGENCELDKAKAAYTQGMVDAMLAVCPYTVGKVEAQQKARASTPGATVKQ